jgi:hypothetical protein
MAGRHRTQRSESDSETQTHLVSGPLSAGSTGVRRSPRSLGSMVRTRLFPSTQIAVE